MRYEVARVEIVRFDNVEFMVYSIGSSCTENSRPNGCDHFNNGIVSCSWYDIGSGCGPFTWPNYSCGNFSGSSSNYYCNNFSGDCTQYNVNEGGHITENVCPSF